MGRFLNTGGVLKAGEEEEGGREKEDEKTQRPGTRRRRPRPGDPEWGETR